MNVDPVGDRRPPPVLRAIEGGRRAPDEAEPADRVEIGGDGDEAPAVRPLKVAEARIKILNDYYSRRDVQRRLAERLMLELDP